MSTITFSIWKLLEMNTEPGLCMVEASKSTFRMLKTTDSPRIINVEKKEAYSVSIKNSKDYIFWMIEHGCIHPRDEFVYNAEMGTTRDNPRTEEELEFREQLFALYDYKRGLFFISDTRKRNIFLKVLNKLGDFNNFEIRGMYIDENEFFNKIQSLSEIRFTMTNDIFSTDAESKKNLERMIGGNPNNDVKLSLEFKSEPINTLKNFIKKLRDESANKRINSLLIRGNDEKGFERVFNSDEFIKKIKLRDVDKEDTDKFSFNCVLSHLISEIERLSDELVK